MVLQTVSSLVTAHISFALAVAFPPDSRVAMASPPTAGPEFSEYFLASKRPPAFFVVLISPILTGVGNVVGSVSFGLTSAGGVYWSGIDSHWPVV